MNQLPGLFAALALNQRELPPAASEKFSRAFAADVVHLPNAVVFSSGGIWRQYENADFLFFIDGDIFYRGEPLRSGININTDFVRHFDPDSLTEINIKGNFNALIISKNSGQHYVLTGALGLKPLFSYSRDGILYLGDDLRFFRRFYPTLAFNELALIQLMLLNFPIGKTTFLKGVELLDAGTYYTCATNFSAEKWYDVEASISGAKHQPKAALDLLHNTFNQVVDQYFSGDARFGVSLTGGFDGRTILSAIKDRSQLQVYTFGSHTSSDIQVAKQICARLRLEHQAFYIDQDYYDQFFQEEAREFILRSNGIGTYERTHYLHAFKQMSDRVDFLLTGNAGSEIFRTVVNGGILIPQTAFDLLQSDDPAQTIRTAIEHHTVLKALEIDPLLYVDQLADSWRDLMSPYQHETDSYRGVYRFFLKETLRKWFGTEMRIENKYLPNRTPFIDEEFLEALHQTPFSVAYQPFLSQNPVQRKIGQTTYSHIMVRNDKKLAKMNTSRGYAPYDVISWVGIPKIAYSFLTKKRRTKNDNDFNQFETAAFFFDHYLDQLSDDTPWLSKEKLQQYYADPSLWKTEIRDFSRIVCLGIWYENMMQPVFNTPAP